MPTSHENRQAVTLYSENQKIFGILHLPLSVQKAPSVLFCHGFGGNKSGRYRFYVELAEALTKRGIAVFRIDFRGSGDSEGNFSDTTLQSQLQDAEIAARFLLEQPNIDPDRFGILGRSFGGAIATLLAAKIPTTKAVALHTPFFDATPWLSTKKSSGEIQVDEKLSQVRFAGHLLSIECVQQMQTLDLKPALDKLSTHPFLLIHGLKDSILGMYHFEQYRRIRQQTSSTTEVVELPNSDHDFGHHEERSRALNKTVDWFTHLL